jgi:DNA processing protein
MTDAHWFSTICPHFFGPSIQRYNCGGSDRVDRVNGQIDGRAVTAPSLVTSGFRRAADWLIEHEQRWLHLLSVRPKLMDLCRHQGIGILWWGDKAYPSSLSSLACPPPVLFYRGDINVLSNRLAISVVGARHPTHLGRRWVQDCIPHLVAKGVCIVSGGARGIDFEAHQAALLHGGRTVAFLPGGVDEPYPKNHGDLFSKIERAGGAIVSEFAPLTPVRPENFVRRNRLIAAAARLVVIVEAGLKSGSMLTAKHAVDQNKDLAVVPGSPSIPSYEGSLQLLFDGAPLARDHLDILGQLGRLTSKSL